MISTYFSWSDEAKELREIAVRSPWLVDKNFVLNHFKTLRIVDKDVSNIANICLSNKKSERLGGHLGEIVTVYVHKTLLDATSLYDVVLFERPVAKMLADSFSIRNVFYVSFFGVTRSFFRS